MPPLLASGAGDGPVKRPPFDEMILPHAVSLGGVALGGIDCRL